MIKFLLAFFLIFNVNAYSQEDENVEIDLKELKRSRVFRVRNKLIKINKEILAKKRQIKKEKNDSIKLKYYEELEQLEKEYLNVELSLIGVITEVNLEEAITVDDDKKFDLSAQLVEVLRPAFDSIKRVSQKPRNIERYRTEIEILEEKLVAVKLANFEIDKQIKNQKSKVTRSLLKRAQKRIKNLVEEIQLKLEDYKVKLHKELAQDKSVITEIQQILTKFLRTKGKNIFISLLVFVLCLWPLRKWRVDILNFLRKYVTRFDIDGSGNSEWLMRPLSVAFTSASILFASIMSLLSLYLLNDWFLVTVIILISAMIIWSLKSSIPMFIEQFKLLMNFGPVREKERVVWNGIPWRVRKLGLYCMLENPFLQGASIRVHSSEILKCQSRLPDRDETWFPTRKGDWVSFGESGIGQVMTQSPEQVVIQNLGGALSYYPTTDFLGMKPTNLSKGYRIHLKFGLDYGLQNKIATEILDDFKDSLLKAFEAEFTGANPKFRKLLVEFENAGSSSLDIAIIVDVNGQNASQKLQIERALNTELVRICNRGNYTIPFNQLNVHLNQISQ